MIAEGMKQELVYAVLKIQLLEAIKSLSEQTTVTENQHQKVVLKLIVNVETRKEHQRIKK